MFTAVLLLWAFTKIHGTNFLGGYIRQKTFCGTPLSGPWTMLCIKFQIWISPAELLSSSAYIINWSDSGENCRVTSQTSPYWTRHDHVMISWTEEQAAFFKSWANKSDNCCLKPQRWCFERQCDRFVRIHIKNYYMWKSQFTLHALLFIYLFIGWMNE